MSAVVKISRKRTLRLTEVWDYYTNNAGTRVVVGMTDSGVPITVPLAFVEVSA